MRCVSNGKEASELFASISDFEGVEKAPLQRRDIENQWECSALQIYSFWGSCRHVNAQMSCKHVQTSTQSCLQCRFEHGMLLWVDEGSQ